MSSIGDLVAGCLAIAASIYLIEHHETAGWVVMFGIVAGVYYIVLGSIGLAKISRQPERGFQVKVKNDGR